MQTQRYEVTEKRARDLTQAELILLKRVGYRPPLAVRVGRAPLHLVEKEIK